MYFRIFWNISLVIAFNSLPFLLEIILQKKWIAKMRSLKIEQVTKLYGPSWHEKTKTGTPTMGGVVFIPAVAAPLVAPLLIFSGANLLFLKDVLVVLSYPLLAAAVGFTDDWIKHKRGSADGLTSIQKFVLQVVTTLFWILLIAPPDTAYVTLLNLGGIKRQLFSPLVGVLLLTFTGVGLQNAVNVTDGLDGLAAGCAAMSMAFSGLILAWRGGSPETLITLLFSLYVCLAFLWHNAHPASVFMGDVGAHFIAGVLFAAFALSDNFLLIVPVSFIFGMEMISVVIQIIAIRFFKRKVFRMSPVHHHFEMLGWSETQIVTRFYIIHLLGFLVTGLICTSF